MGSLAGAMPMNESLNASPASTPKLSYAQAVGASSFGASSEAAKAFRSAASHAAAPRRRPLGGWAMGRLITFLTLDDGTMLEVEILDFAGEPPADQGGGGGGGGGGA